MSGNKLNFVVQAIAITVACAATINLHKTIFIDRSLTPPAISTLSHQIERAQTQLLVPSLGSAPADNSGAELNTTEEEFECASVASFPYRSSVRPTTC